MPGYQPTLEHSVKRKKLCKIRAISPSNGHVDRLRPRIGRPPATFKNSIGFFRSIPSLTISKRMESAYIFCSRERAAISVWSSGGRILDGRDLRCVNIGHRGKAFFVETIEGAGGVIIPPVGCLLTLREAYRGNEIFLSPTR
jgi:hypothetical protein